MLTMRKLFLGLTFLYWFLSSSHSMASTLFEEAFDNTNLASRGWYDNINPVISTTERIPGSAGSVEFRFLKGATKPVSGGSIRRKFPESESVYVKLYIKHSSNWTGSNKAYHPHQFMILTNLENDWANLAYTKLTAYMEENAGAPVLAIQDGQNIDVTRVNQDLTKITEARSVAGCNGDSDGYGNGSCYSVGAGEYWNGKSWKNGAIYFSDTAGPYYKGDWHLVEAYFKLNSIVNGKGVADGVIRYWYDGQLVANHSNVMLRTGQHPSMKFNQFVIAPYIGDGSPVDQTFWIDNLTVATARDEGSVPSAPASLRVAGQ